ncbi:MAG: hypothetical protein GX878_07225 [Firmicutes bacterium]|nr:hypothetical protein [Bacillota bacterium]
MIPFTSEAIALIDKIYLLLQLERTLLESTHPDWAQIEDNLVSVEKLFKLLDLKLKESAGSGESQSEHLIYRSFNEVIALRRENFKILQDKAGELGHRLSSFKQEKAAILAYTAGKAGANLLK